MFEAATYTVKRCVLERGDLLVMHSDGITEAANEQGTTLDETGLRTMLASSRSTSIEQLGPKILAAVTRYAQRTRSVDDLTIVALRRAEDG